MPRFRTVWGTSSQALVRITLTQAAICLKVTGYSGE